MRHARAPATRPRRRSASRLGLGLLAAGLTLVACRGDRDDRPPPPDVSGIEVALDLRRFEVDLARQAADSTRDGAAELRARYPVFFDSVWLELMVPGRGSEYDSALVAAFGREPALTRLLDSVLAVYPADAPLPFRDDLAQALRYARYYLPEAPTPRVVTYVSEFALGNFTYGPELLGLGLDFYLGAGFSGYAAGVFPNYIQRTMNAEHAVPRAVEAWLSALAGEASGERMLDRMLHNGKLMYARRLLLPHLPDTAVLGFGESQLAWLRDNERHVWAHYLDEELLYDTRPSRIGKHVGPSPNAPGMPPEAPGGGANWVGMRIVEAYARRHPGTTLTELLAMRDAQALLTASRYKPM